MFMFLSCFKKIISEPEEDSDYIDQVGGIWYPDSELNVEHRMALASLTSSNKNEQY